MREQFLGVTIAGPAKSGKSRLAAEMAADLVDRGYAVTVTDEGETSSYRPLDGREPRAMVKIATMAAYKGSGGGSPQRRETV